MFPFEQAVTNRRKGETHKGVGNPDGSTFLQKINKEVIRLAREGHPDALSHIENYQHAKIWTQEELDCLNYLLSIPKRRLMKERRDLIFDEPISVPAFYGDEAYPTTPLWSVYLQNRIWLCCLQFNHNGMITYYLVKMPKDKPIKPMCNVTHWCLLMGLDQ